MTPQEKAQDLVNSFYYSLPNNGSETGINSTTSRYGEAKKCALIACNEVLGYMGADRGYEFWTEVKKEIIKL